MGRAISLEKQEGQPGSTMIQLRSVEKTIKSPAGTIWLLRRISLEIEQGEFVTIMGPSGAGKTTLMSILGMLDDQWAGEY
jgi:putative ABC transport system ATP-binding protein